MPAPVLFGAVLACLGLAAYVYLGYPLLVGLLARWWGRPVKRGPAVGRVTVVISSFNDGARLEAKIRALRAGPDYDRVEQILVGLDGATDDTAARLAALAEPKLQVFAFPERRGKPSVLNDLVPRAAADVLVMTDARQILDDGAVTALLENLADPEVGVVSGELVFTADGRPTPTAQGMRGYWGYEKWIRRQESRFRSVPGATGALYAVRKSLFTPLPVDTILDDVWVPMGAIRKGRRCCFEGRARAYDRPSEKAAQETRRKRRTLAGNLQLIQLSPSLLNPGANPIWWEFISHKLGRLLVGPALLMGWVIAGLGCENALLWVCWWTGWAFLALAGVGRVMAGLIGRGGWWSLPWSFLALSGVVFLAWRDVLTGRLNVRW